MRHEEEWMKVVRLLLMSVLLTSGCTWSGVRDLDTRVPEPPKHVLLLGRVEMPPDPFRAEWKASWWQHQPHFDKGVQDWLGRNRSDWTFAKLDDRRPIGALPPGSVVLTGTITSFSYGVPAARALVGMGAGQEKVSGDFEVRAADGRLLAKFHSRESYLGGFGIGGFDFITMDTLVRRFAETTAEKTVEVVAPKKSADAR
jgi:hypothetical protein